MRDVTELLDDHCRDFYGHSDWSCLDMCDKKDLTREHEIIIWENQKIVVFLNPKEEFIY